MSWVVACCQCCDDSIGGDSFCLCFQPSLQRLPVMASPSLSPFVLTRHLFREAASLQDADAAQAAEALACYKDRPWAYLESEGT